MTMSAEHRELIADTANYIAYEHAHGHTSIVQAIRSFTPQTLKRINGFGLHEAQREMLGYGLLSFGWSEAVANDYLYIARSGHENILTDDVKKHVDALKFYNGVLPQSHGVYPSERGEQIVAITRMLWYLEQREEDTLVPFKDGNTWKALPFINEPKLRDLIVKSPQRETVVNIITERDILDADVITTMLESSIPALFDGVL